MVSAHYTLRKRENNMTLRGIFVMVLTVLVLAAAIAPAFAQQYPNVSNLKPFVPEANFMSLLSRSGSSASRSARPSSTVKRAARS